MTLSIFINGALRLRVPYRHDQAAEASAALAENLPKISGRLGVVVEEGNVAWLITGARGP